MIPMDDTRRVMEGPFCGLRMPDFTDMLDLDAFDRAVARGDHAECKRLRTAYGPDSARRPGPCASHYPSVEP